MSINSMQPTIKSGVILWAALAVSLIFNLEVEAQQNLFTQHDLDIGRFEGSPHIADFNGDGRNDFVATDGSNIAWFENDGRGGFSIHYVLQNHGMITCVSTCDLDQDGDTDILNCAYVDNNDMNWWENDGEGGFTIHEIDNRLHYQTWIESCDWDGDGDLDIMVAHYDANVTYWYRNRGDNTFERLTLIEGLGRTMNISPCDIDGDGDLDAFILMYNNINKMDWIEQVDANDFELRDGNYWMSCNCMPQIFDLEGDGDIDFLGDNVGENAFYAYVNNGHGEFQSRVIKNNLPGVRQSLVYDFDLDGGRDVVTLSGWASGIWFWRNTGQYQFDDGIRLLEQFDVGTGVARGDFNGDGVQDLLVMGMSQQDGSRGGAWFEINLPELEWPDRDYNFGEVPIYSSVDSALVVSNDGETDAVLTLREISDAAFSLLPGNQVIIPPGESRELTIRFSPTEVRQYEAAIQIQTNTAEGVVQLNVSGVGASDYGSLHGIVLDASTGEGLPDAELRLTPSDLSCRSDAEGHFLIEQVPAISYQITCNLANFLPWIDEEVAIGANEDVSLDIQLLHAEMSPSFQSLYREMQPNQQLSQTLRIYNGGNGALEWTLTRHYPEGIHTGAFTLRQTLTAGETVNDNRIQGVAFAEGDFFLSGAADSVPHAIYRLDRDGNEVSRFQQFGNSRYGYKDLDYDGELLWGGDGSTMFGFTTSGELVKHWQVNLNPVTAIAWDEALQGLWVSGITTDILFYDREGNRLDRSIHRVNNWGISGLACCPEDPEGMRLYFVNSTANQEHQVYKLDPEHPESLTLANTIVEGRSVNPGGAFITNEWDPYNWVLITSPVDDNIYIWELQSRESWLDVSPVSGLVEPDEYEEVAIDFNSERLPIGTQMNCDLVFDHNGVGGQFTLPIELTVTGNQENRDFRLGLQEGWNLIGSPLTPVDPTMATVWANLVGAEQLILVKNQDGQFYAPAYGFNNLPPWDARFGYHANVTSACDLVLHGQPLAEDTPVPLRDGWSVISYFPSQPTTPDQAFCSCCDQIVLVKDGMGRFYAPRYDFCNITSLNCGSGYKVLTEGEAELIWGTGNRQRAASSTSFTPWLATSHFQPAKPTETNMSLLAFCQFSNPQESASVKEWEIAAFNQAGLCVGGAKLPDITDPAQPLQEGLAVWEDDPTTDEVDGATPGEALRFMAWDGVSERELDASWTCGNGKFQPDGFGSIKLFSEVPSASVSPAVFQLTGAFPNPANGAMKIAFALKEYGQYRMTLSDCAGRLVEVIASGESVAGTHTVAWDAGATPAGLYICRLTASGETTASKILIVK